METTSFTSLAAEHVELDQLFNTHQRALIARDLELALAAIGTFRNRFDAHIDFEERRLLPLYADKYAETPGGTLEIFQAEHRKLREMAKRLAEVTELLLSSDDVVGSVLTLLDEESLFKGLFHHHAVREENLLFPRLDERTSEEERKTWLFPSLAGK